MRRSILLGLGVLLLAPCLPPGILAQEIKVTNILARNFEATGGVVELDVPEGLDGRRFGIVWVASDGPRGVAWHVSRQGKHCYEVRHQREWRGRILAVGVTLDGAPGRIRPPTATDEVDIFLEPERITPGTVNALIGHTLLGWRWEALLLILCLGTAGALAARRRPPLLSTVWAFLIAWGAMDLRAGYDHLATVTEIEARQLDVPPLVTARPFADQAAEIVGGDTWSLEPLTGVVQSYVRYRLADRAYLPLDARPRSAYLITKQPGEGQLLLQLGEYCLLRRERW